MKTLYLLLGLILLGSNITVAQSTVSPPNDLTETEAYSIFYQNYNNEDYEGAVEFGSWIWKSMPRTLEGYAGFDLEKNLGRFITIYGALADNATDPSVKESYADTALMIFDKVFSEYGEDEISYYDWHMRKGRFLQQHAEFIENGSEKAIDAYKKAMEIDQEKFITSGDGYYVKVLLQNMVANEQKEEALALMEEAEEYTNGSLDGVFNQFRNKLFDTPEERIGFLKSQLEEDPENTTLLKDLRSVYEDEGMTEEVLAVTETLYGIEANYENTRALAEAAESDANYSDAIRYYSEALDKAPDDEAKADIAMTLSQIHLNESNLQEARKFARQAMNLNPEAGEPYLQIASIYARAVQNCTSNREISRDDQAVYWVVIDYLRQAKRVDSSVANRADTQIERYNTVAPSISDIHFVSSWKQGGEISIDSTLDSCYGWINETTTIPNFE